MEMARSMLKDLKMDGIFRAEAMNVVYLLNRAPTKALDGITPQQNGICERRNRTIVEMVRIMLKDAKMDGMFRIEAMNTVVYLLNRAPTKALDRITLEEAWS